MMQVTNRHSQKEPVSFDKISNRIAALCYGLDHVDPFLVAKDTISSMYDGITTKELDILSADICSVKSSKFPDYGKLAGRILASNLDKSTEEEYFKVVKLLFDNQILSEAFYKFCSENTLKIQEMLDYSRDYLFDYFAIKTLERSYLIKVNGQIVERPQHMWMRVAIQLHGCHKNGFTIPVEERLSKIKETYEYLSQLYFTHATPTLFNSGIQRPQLSSCHVADTEVFTINDGVKKIQDVKIGDLVITHKNRAMPVVQLHKNPLGERKNF
jgi:ribonucleoside-diphosphate reductase alpha chain